jgi:hypothetical protein
VLEDEEKPLTLATGNHQYAKSIAVVVPASAFEMKEFYAEDKKMMAGSVNLRNL